MIGHRDQRPVNGQDHSTEDGRLIARVRIAGQSADGRNSWPGRRGW